MPSWELPWKKSLWPLWWSGLKLPFILSKRFSFYIALVFQLQSVVSFFIVSPCSTEWLIMLLGTNTILPSSFHLYLAEQVYKIMLDHGINCKVINHSINYHLWSISGYPNYKTYRNLHSNGLYVSLRVSS